MELYRKKVLVEVVEELGNGVVLQNKDIPSKKWFISTETFNKTYEKVNKSK